MTGVILDFPKATQPKIGVCPTCDAVHYERDLEHMRIVASPWRELVLWVCRYCDNDYVYCVPYSPLGSGTRGAA